MIFSLDEYKSVYFRIPKVASTSIMIALKKVCELRESSGYNNSYFKFAFVRNPFDRLVSSFKHVIQKGALQRINDDPELHRGMSFDDFVNVISKKRVDEMDIHFRPQHTYIPEKPDFLGRFENLEEDFNILCGKLGIKLDLPHKNFTSKTNYRDYYTKESIKKVLKIYKRDFETLGYSKEL